MEDHSPIIPAAAFKGIATGLLMMSVFTLIWASIAFGGLHGISWWFVLLVFLCLMTIG